MIIDLKISEKYEDIVTELTSHLLPAISITNITLNLINVLIFSKRRLFREKTFQYFQLNSFIDFVYLLVVVSKPLMLNLLDIHVYFNITNIIFIYSKLIKIQLSFDKLTKMTTGTKFRFKLSNLKLTISFLSIGFILNIPILFNYDSFEYLWFKFNYFELMIVNSNNSDSSVFIIIISFYLILLDTLFLYLLIRISINLRKSMIQNMKSVNRLTTDSNKSFIIQMAHHKNSSRKNIQEYEIERQKICSLILINNVFYSIGWSISILSHWFQFCINLIYGSLNVYYGYNYYAYLDLINIIACLILTWIMGFNFFVYFFNIHNFRLVAMGKRKQFISNYCFYKPDILKM